MPLWQVHTLPLFDYPNHLARMHILASDSGELRRFYAVDWRIVPNLAMDLIVPPLSTILPLEAAGRVFIMLTMLSLVGGVAFLHRVLFLRWSPWPLLSFALLYNRFMLWGFLNFLFGTGLAIAALGWWIGWRERAPRLCIAVACVLSLAVFLSHLAAFGCYAIALGAFELDQMRRRPRAIPTRLATAALPFVMPAILFLTGPSGAGGAIVFSRALRKFDLPYSLFNNYTPPLDAATMVLFVALFGIGLWRGWLRIAPAMQAPLMALIAAYLVMPNQIYTASSVDHRLPLVIALMAIGGSNLEPVLRWSREVTGLAVATYLARLIVISVQWQGFDRVYEVDRAALDQLPTGARIAVASPDDGLRIRAGEPPMVHFPCWAIIDRDAFVPILFAYPTQQPIGFKPSYTDQPSVSALWSDLVTADASRPLPSSLDAYDYVVLAAPTGFDVAERAGWVSQYQSPLFRIYRLLH
jgi:hypothetical protein